MRYITVFFLVATAVLYTHSLAAPITADLSILPHPHYQDGQIQQDSVPDPGFRKWFNEISSGVYKVIAKFVKNSDPKKVEEFKEYIKGMRTFASPVENFVRQYYPNDIVANNIIDDIDKWLSSLDKLVEEYSVSRKDTESLAISELMRMLETVTS